ncbi:glycosyltransferase family 4 protein [Plastoroseomonas arctica]|uniref:Glycosyltransferase family 4 protein n=1 Tax=Plastoroseomonas arctica TaxID=1509237 RepID=A0AAF1JV19_9PROT|nr:glycosyltransferase [Plastoroseomonas arctica]MBR0654307.1 glycosyltransferase family 4 protein [Plastoroseomonas arctica]
MSETFVRNGPAVVVYFNGAFINQENGAHRRMSDLMMFLVSIDARIVFYSYRDHNAWPWRDTEIRQFGELYPGAELVLEESSILVRAWTRIKVLLAALSPNLAVRAFRLRIPYLSPRLQAISCRSELSLFIVHYARGLIEVNGLPDADVILETHDLAFLSGLKQSGGNVTDARTMLKARGELTVLGSVGGLIGIAPAEVSFFRMLLPDTKTYYVPKYSGVPSPQILPSPESNIRHDVLFVGSENPFNARGLIRFIHEHRTWLNTRRFAIAGRVCGVADVVAAARSVGAVMLDYVEDLAGVYAVSRIVVSPVDGTGLKIKVIDALSRGRPVFGSPHTMASLPPGFEGCVFPIDETEMDRMLSDEAWRVHAGKAAIRYASTLNEMGDCEALKARLLAWPAPNLSVEKASFSGVIPKTAGAHARD